MKFHHITWNIEELSSKVIGGNLNLSPSYQRNEVWTQKDQRELISTILKGWPLPSLFVLEKEAGKSEMVDGKQRTFAIFNFLNDRLRGPDGKYFSELTSSDKETFLQYPLPVVVIDDLGDGSKVEQFYAVVNRSGLRLNRPEVTKAEYADAPFHKLVDELANDERLLSLDVFTERNTVRMNNYELIAEVLATNEFGFFDKKTGVDKLYQIDQEENSLWSRMRTEYDALLSILIELDRLIPLKITRFKKRADFLSLSIFFLRNRNAPAEALGYAHNLFYIVSPGIAPTNEACDVLRSYAHYCVSQSHMKASREARHNILTDLLSNTEIYPTLAQKSLMDYFGISSEKNATKRVGNWTSVNDDLLSANFPKDRFFGEPESIEFPF